jgi:guanylate kinase
MAHSGSARLFIISAPSGSGKTTLCKRLLQEDVGLFHSVSVTTRKPRKGEKNGTDYHFVSKARFREMIRKRRFLEHEENFGNFYGTPRTPIENALKDRRSVILSIDVKGAMKVARAYPKESVLIFILPPSMKALKKRLHLRKLDGPGAISRRLKLARKEIAYKARYDYRVVNNSLDEAYRRLKRIISSEVIKAVLGGKSGRHANR